MANANIENIDYDWIVYYASSISGLANSMQSAINRAFQTIDSMRECWFGNSYDNFIDVVNASVFTLNLLFKTTVHDIPSEIAAKAKSYAVANQSSCSSSLYEYDVLTLTEISKTNKGSQLRFQTDKISSCQNTIGEEFQTARNEIDSATWNYCEKLKPVWKSVSGDTNIEELEMELNAVKTIINQISKALDNHITAQANTINIIESAASAVEAAGQIKEDAITEVETTAQNWKQKIEEGAAQTWKNLTGKN